MDCLILCVDVFQYLKTECEYWWDSFYSQKNYDLVVVTNIYVEDINVTFFITTGHHYCFKKKRDDAGELLAILQYSQENKAPIKVIGSLFGELQLSRDLRDRVTIIYHNLIPCLDHPDYTEVVTDLSFRRFIIANDQTSQFIKGAKYELIYRDFCSEFPTTTGKNSYKLIESVQMLEYPGDDYKLIRNDTVAL
jgi:hypothetical protein